MAGSGSGNPVVTAALAKMAMLRQASDVSEMTLDLYTAELEKFLIEPEAVLIACARLQYQPRAEGETAFPSFGTLLKQCRIVAEELHSRKVADEHRKFLAATGQLEPPSDPPAPFTKAQGKAFITQMRRDVSEYRKSMTKGTR